MPDREDAVLEIEHLTVHYVLEEETVEAVNDISLTVNKGKTLGLVGETGAGKTTAALAAIKLIPDPPGVVKEGKITVCGHSILEMSAGQLEKIRGKEISMIFQDPMTSLNPVFTVGEQIAESIEFHEGLDKGEAYRKAEEMLELVGIPRERAGEYPHQFSGGMRQRVVIAIALTCNPKLLIADEPTTALDVTIQAQILDLMNGLKKDIGTSILFITHDLGVVAEVCDEVVVMYCGRVVEKADVNALFAHPTHPYTKGLLNSIPKLGEAAEELEAIPGNVPNPKYMPKGCKFAPRCSHAFQKCLEEEPGFYEVEEGHLCRCWLCEKGGA